VMSADLLGETFDIHMGGADLIFPHHENEIAQSEAATGKPLARYWLHNGFLKINNEKMSKSLGNFFSIDEVLAQFEAPVVRYFLLEAHYRAPLDFSDAALRETATALKRLREARRTARKLGEGGGGAVPDSGGGLPEPVRAVYDAFETAMDDDFNTPRALAALFEAATEVNQIENRLLEAEKGGAQLAEADRVLAAQFGAALDDLAGGVLGLDLEVPDDAMGDLSARLMDLVIEIRAQARREKQWAIADRIRTGLGDLGIALHDRPGGRTEWEKTNH